MINLSGDILQATGRHTLWGAPEGHDAHVLAHLARMHGGAWLHVAVDDARMALLEELVAFFDPQLEVIALPAWDCLPYDRVSPHSSVVGQRVEALSRLAARKDDDGPVLVLTTINAAAQRVPPREAFAHAAFSAQVGDRVDLGHLTNFLVHNGYNRTDTVREPGEYAIRGGIIDLFPPAMDEPVRLDLFGDEVESIRSFDAMSQRSTDSLNVLVLRPVSEIFLDEKSIARFRSQYRETFGAVKDDDALYEAVSEGRRHGGMEHWLPLFFEHMSTLMDYLPDASPLSCDNNVEAARAERQTQVADFYAARLSMMENAGKGAGSVYKPLPVELLYIDGDEWRGLLDTRCVLDLAPFAAPEGDATSKRFAAGGRKARDFGDVRAAAGDKLYETVRDYIHDQHDEGHTVLLVAYSAGAGERLRNVLGEHGVKDVITIDRWDEVADAGKSATCMGVVGLSSGYVAPGLCVITEQDILGDRLARPVRRKKDSENFIREVSSLNPGDLVVHAEHGVGRFEGLETLEVAGARHDCLKVIYDGGDKLFVPVENIEMLSRYGSDSATASLDKLGGVGWQARKAKVKKDLLAMADHLLEIAAAREMQKTEPLTIEDGRYAEFCARFPYPETDDQLRSIDQVIADLAKGRAMDRLVCGDVGFGKTEVALRAAFVAAMAGYQVAVVVPTTLLARQHFKNFTERFKGLPLRIQQLSRLVKPTEAKRIKDELAKGSVNIIIGTHALLGKNIKFNHLGLVVVDEEQHFGVKQKEKLKELARNVHVLTLTATPIPRTLQLALTGVRELSLITTPPVDRLAVRTFVLPYDAVIIREALMREHYRGGQSFYVCPRVADLEEVRDGLKELVPEIRVVMAHGQMPAEDLEDRMTAFYDGQYDVLLATNIIESGLDIPNANTMVVHRAEMFGLAQLYQIRGRIGRSKQRAYAYLTYKQGKILNKTAEQRLHIIETLDSLGGGFELASHDLDIRGAGNLLGEEQSGHIREVGIELYQQMLEEAVAMARAGVSLEDITDDDWTPQINLGTSVLIPETYIEDLHVRLSIYRRISELVDHDEIEGFAAELIDRFGSLPEEVENLLDIVAIKQKCKQAAIERIEAGPKGAVITFRNNRFEHVDKLVVWIADQAGTVKLRPDEKLVVIRSWKSNAERVRGVKNLTADLARLSGRKLAA